MTDPNDLDPSKLRISESKAALLMEYDWARSLGLSDKEFTAAYCNLVLRQHLGAISRLASALTGFAAAARAFDTALAYEGDAAVLREVGIDPEVEE